MNTKQAIVITCLAVAVGGVLAWRLVSDLPPQRAQPGGELAPALATPKVAVTPNNSAPGTDEVFGEATLSPQKSVAQSKDKKSGDSVPAEPPIMINGYELQDPLARVALNFVGSEPEANAYWIGAINDSALPAEERKDLIEDLNEDGLSDPRHPAAEDMPLIVARLRLIEQLAPNALDDVNRDAFREAYKDLTDLLNGKEPQ
jgi:hypothetical protein